MTPLSPNNAPLSFALSCRQIKFGVVLTEIGRWDALVVELYSLPPSSTLLATLVPGRRDHASNHFPINTAPTLNPVIEI